ncbi:MAG: SBBP repeat-containing protein [Bacteroidota bacterium]
MKKLFTLLTLTLLCKIMTPQSSNWVKNLGDTTANTIGEYITTDALGNVYTTGYFIGTVDFDPSPSTFTLASTSLYADVFISKLDAFGNFLWAKIIKGTDFSYSNSIAADSIGNIYITGEFQGIVDFDPNSGIQQYSSTSTDIFILKLDAMGNFNWVKTIGDASTDSGRSITLDKFANVYIAGNFSGTIDFDSSSGVSNLTSNSGTFILKLESNGNFVWVKGMLGTTIYPRCIKLDKTGNIYTTGTFYGAVDFDPSTSNHDSLNSNIGGSIFVSKLDNSGNYIWAKNMGDPGQIYETGYSIAIDHLGCVYCIGRFAGTGDFDPNIGSYFLTTIGIQDMFISKLDVNGNFMWAKSIGNIGYSTFGFSIELNNFGDIYATGSFENTTDFDPGNSIFTLTSAGSLNAYLLKLTSTGNFVSVTPFNSTGISEGRSLTINHSDNIYMTGVYNATANFDINGENTTLTSSSISVNTYILKQSLNIIGINEILEDNKTLNIFPNPNNGEFNIVSKERMILTVVNNLGQTIQTIQLNEANGYQQNINVNTSGLYYINGVTVQSSIKQKVIVTE